MGDQFKHGAQGGRLFVGGGRSVFRKMVGDAEFDTGLGFGAQGLQGGGASGAEEIVRVGLLGHEEEAKLQPGLEGEGEDAQGGFPACAVAIEQAFDGRRFIAPQQGELIFGDGSALGGHGGMEPDSPAADGVELSLDHEEGVALFEVGAGVIESEEDAALVEDLRLWGVDVFGLAGGVIGRGLGKLAGSEGDDAALHIADRNHQAASKTRLEAPVVGLVIAGEEETGCLHDGWGDVFFLADPGQCEGIGRGVADLELSCGLQRESPVLLPVAADIGGLSGGIEAVVEPVGGEFVKVEELLAHREFFTAGTPCFILQGDIVAFGQKLDRLAEIEILHAHDEGETVAALSGAEAFVEAPVRVDVEGGGLLLGEGAEALPGAARALEL